jgi:protein ImuB
MFAALYSLSARVTTLTGVAQSFSPRVEVAGRLVLCDLLGVARLFGGARDIAEHLRRALVDAGAVRVAVAPTHTAAALLALGRPAVSVVASADEARAVLAQLPVATLAEWDTIHAGPPDDASRRAPALPTGWVHPRDTHQGPQTRRQVRGRVQLPRGSRTADAAARTRATQALDVLRRWGIRTLGQYAALPAAELSARLGPLGPRWQRAACGHDMSPLVPLVDDEPFEASLALEWPVEGLEPLSFVLGRVLEPLAARLERADRGAAVLHTELHLTTRESHVRTLQLPAPMRDPKTLRTLILLDLESHPPSAAIDRVVVRVEPTPGRIVQWSLLERAQPSPEQVSTLLARLSALMGESHVGSPQLVDSWRPGAFSMKPFGLDGKRLAASGSRLDEISEQGLAIRGLRLENTKHDATSSVKTGSVTAGSVTAGSTSREPLAASRYQDRSCSVAFRRFRLPVPARVTVHDGRPVRLIPDRRGISGGAVVDCAGPWRTSGHWWDDPATDTPSPRAATRWDRDEWDVVLADGVSCRVFLEREVGQWFIDGTFD